MTHLNELPPNPPNMFPDPAYVAKQEERERLIKALVGEPEERPHGLASWLRTEVSELRERGPSPDNDDPDAYYMMVREMEELLRLLEQLTDLEHGKTDPTALVEKRSRLLTVDDDIPL